LNYPEIIGIRAEGLNLVENGTIETLGVAGKTSFGLVTRTV